MFSLRPIALSHCLQSGHGKITHKKMWEQIKSTLCEWKKNVWNIFRSISLQIVLCCFHVISFVSHAFTVNSVFFAHCSVRLLCYLRNANIMDENNWITICVMCLRLVLTTFSCSVLSIHVNVMVFVWYPISRFSLHRLRHLSSYHFVNKI